MPIAELILFADLLILIVTYFYKNAQISAYKDHDLELIAVDHAKN